MRFARRAIILAAGVVFSLCALGCGNAGATIATTLCWSTGCPIGKNPVTTWAAGEGASSSGSSSSGGDATSSLEPDSGGGSSSSGGSDSGGGSSSGGGYGHGGGSNPGGEPGSGAGPPYHHEPRPLVSDPVLAPDYDDPTPDYDTPLPGDGCLGVCPTTSVSRSTGRLGTALTIEDRSFDIDTGNVDSDTVTSYTVSNLQPSSDVVNAPLAGRLWEATVTVNVVRGGLVAPASPFFNARSAGGDNYRVLYQVAAPNGLSPALVPPGGQASGKIYFDVTGPPPTEVVYSNGLQDLLVWN